MARLSISFINPLHFVETEPVIPSQYESKHMEDFWLEDRLNRWQHAPRWAQPWRQDDPLMMQFLNNAGVIQLDVINCFKTVVMSTTMTQVRQDSKQPDYFIYELNWAPFVNLRGTHWVVLRVGGNIEAVSEPVNVQAEHPGTMLLQYSNTEFYEGITFETGVTSSIRVPAMLQKKPTASKDTVYEDQDLDMVMIHSKPYRLWDFYLGAGIFDPGVPDWMEDKIGRILGCNTLRLDGRYFTKNEGAKLEPVDTYYNDALKTFRIELRERINRHSRIFDTVDDSNEQLTILLNSTTRGFSDTGGDQDGVVQFIDVG